MEAKKTPNRQSNHEREKWNRKNQPSRFQTVLQSYINQDSMVLLKTTTTNID